MSFNLFFPKILLTILAISLVQPSFGQRELHNQKSEKHQLVTGTDIYMIPPPNFINPGIPGFVSPAANAMIGVSKIPDSNFSNSENDLKSIIEGLKLVGPVEELDFDGISGKFFTSEEVRDGDPFTNQTLFFGNEDFVYIVLAVCPSDHPGVIDSMKEAIFSIVYEPNASEGNQSSFSVMVENTKLNRAGERAGMKFYTVDGNMPSQSDDKTAFIIGSSLYPVEMENSREYAVERIKQLPYVGTDVRPDQLREVQIAGLTGFEYDFIGSKGINKPEELVFVVMLFQDDQYYLLIGNTLEDFESNLELFQKVASTFRID